MEPRAHHVLIGLFTVVVIAAAMFFAIWLSHNSSDNETRDYDVIFKEAVTGLSQGSAVEYSGIKVGEVISLHLDPIDPRKVLARIRVRNSTPIKINTQARLSITGVTGAAIIQLHGGSPKSPMLEGVDGKLPQIIADPSPLSRLMTNSEDFLLSITSLLNRAHALFSEQNIDNLSRTLNNLQKTTTSIANQRDDLRSSLQQMGEASREAAQLMRTANQLLSVQGRESLDSANRAMASLERSSAAVEQILQTNKGAINSGMQGVAELGPAIIELRKTLSNLSSFARNLEENPTGYLLNSDSIKEFKP